MNCIMQDASISCFRMVFCGSGRRFVSCLLALLATCFLVSSVQAKYNGGTGEPNNPYRISDAYDMNEIGSHSSDWGKHFVLTSDINLSAYAGAQFNIIGSIATNFSGLFDGNGHTISNFTYSSTIDDTVGLFGRVGGGGQIRNLRLLNPDIDVLSADYVGSLAGFLGDGDIVGCIAENVSLNGEGTFDSGIGGLIGVNDSGTIFRCYVTGDVAGVTRVGGLVGTNRGAIIECITEGSVFADFSSAGGLVGGQDGSSTLRNSCTSASSSGYRWIGGLIGANDYGSIYNCYSTGDVSGTVTVGGLIGGIVSGTTESSFWNVDSSGQTFGIGNASDPEVIGLTTEQMQTKSSFTNSDWDFVGETVNGPNDIWTIHEGVNYPKHVWILVNFVGWYEVDFADFASFANRWWNENCGNSNDCDGTDLDFSDAVGVADLRIFCSYWGMGMMEETSE